MQYSGLAWDGAGRKMADFKELKAEPGLGVEGEVEGSPDIGHGDLS